MLKISLDQSCFAKVMDYVILQLSSKDLVQTNEKPLPMFMEKKWVENIDLPIPYDEFFQKHMLQNSPCVFKSWATKDWPCCDLWTKVDKGLVVPDFTQLDTLCGTSTVPVADCRSKEFNAFPKADWLFKDFKGYMEKYKSMGHPSTMPCLYLKDWHFFRDFPEEEFYSVPDYFRSDWLFELWNLHLPPFHDDYRFVYIGPKNSWTPFHADVMRSYSWSANVCGRKKWIFFPPGYEDTLRDDSGNLPFDVSELHEVHYQSEAVEVIQEAGELIFVPSGWHHQVYNLEDTISINHNWLNGCNVHHVWCFLKNELKDVQHEIEDCRSLMSRDEWIDQCQLILKTNSGIDFAGFLLLLKNIADLRMNAVTATIKLDQITEVENEGDDSTSVAENVTDALHQLRVLLDGRSYKVNFFHDVADLCLIIPVLLDMAANSHVQHVTCRYSQCIGTLHEIHRCLQGFKSYLNSLCEVDEGGVAL